MKPQVQESLTKIRESFRTIKSTAEKASVKFKEEGKPFLYARDCRIGGSSEYNDDQFIQRVKDTCDFFPKLSSQYADQTVIDNIIADPKSEADKALCDYNLYRLNEYCKVDNKSIAVLENNQVGGLGINNPDESAIKTVNDRVRLVNTEAYKTHKMYIYEQNLKHTCNKPKDYSLSRKQKEDKIRNQIINQSESQRYDKIKNFKEDGYKPVPKKKLLDPIDGFFNGFSIEKNYLLALSVFILIAAIIVAVSMGYHPDEPNINTLQRIVNFCIGVVMIVLQLGIFAIPVFVLIVGGYIYIFVYGVLIISGIVCAVYCLVLNVFILLTRPFNNMIIAKKNAEEKIWYDQKLKNMESDFYNYFNSKYSAQINDELERWENEKRSYDAFVQRLKYIEANKEQAEKNYYKEIARVAATSEPIVTSILDDLKIIKRNLNQINVEYAKLCSALNARFVSDDALICYNYIINGEVNTYDQAILMHKNMTAAEKYRDDRRREQKMAEERRRIEEERREREFKEQWEREKREKERIKEEERKEEEKLRRIEKALHDAKMAQYDQTKAVLTAALATVRTMNEQNELIEENNKLLEKIDKGY